MRFKSTLAAAVLMLAPIAFAHAVPVTLDFTATGFGGGAPASNVSGTLVYEADSVASTTINSLTSIDLTIAGHTYALGEIGFISPFGISQNLLGGTACAVNCITHGTNDFWLQWSATSQTGLSFAYSVVGGSFYNTSTFSEFKIAATRVPEPMSITLIGAGLLAMWGMSRRRSTNS